MTINAILVDFDGTLVSSEYANSCAYSEALRSHGFDFNVSSISGLSVGRHWSDFLPDLLGDLYTPSLGSSIAIEKKRIYSSYHHKITLNNELVSMLMMLKTSVSLVLITNASRQSVTEILRYFNLDDLFAFLICQEDVKSPKPNPEPYLLAISRLGLNAINCLAIEDSDVGITAAVASNLPVIRVSSFTHGT